jgi:hypothetical protein
MKNPGNPGFFFSSHLSFVLQNFYPSQVAKLTFPDYPCNTIFVGSNPP